MLFAPFPMIAQAQSIGATQTWRTYLGGNGDDQVLSVAVDNFGHVYVAGRTTEGTLLGNDTTGQSGLTHQNTYGGGSSDGFLAKFAPQGSMLWCTYFGGPGDDEAVQVVLIGMEGVMLIGNTNSTSGIATDTLSLQVTHGGGSDMFVAHFTEYGLLLSATYFGGTDDEFASGAALDVFGKLMVCGSSTGPDSFTGSTTPVQPWTAGTDGLLLRFQSTDSMLAGSYIGGQGDDVLVQLTVGDSTGFHLLGNTTSATGIATANGWISDAQGGTDAFIMKADTNLTVLLSSYFGGAEDDRATGLVQRGNELILCGLTYSDSLFADSTAFNTVNSGGGDGFLAILDSSLTLSWSTFIGDTAYDMLTALQVDLKGRIYAVGITASDNNIATSSGGGPSIFGGMDAFAMRVDSGQTLAWSRYIGAMGEEEAHAFDLGGNTYLFIGGRTTSDVFFAITGHQMEHGGGIWDGSMVRLEQVESTICNGICTGTSGGGGSGNYNGITDPLNEFHVCLGDSITFIVHGGALGSGARWMWYKDDCGEPSHFLTTGDTITFAPTESFILSVRAESLSNVTGCRYLPIIVHSYPEPYFTVTDSACGGAPVTFMGGDAESFSWALGDTLVFGTSQTIPAPMEPGMHQVEMTGTNGPFCSVTRTDSLFVRSAPEALWSITNVTCAGGSDGTITLDSTSQTTLLVEWETAGLAGPLLTGLSAGSYIATVSDAFGCSATDTLLVEMPVQLIDSVSTTDALCGEAAGSMQVHSVSIAPGLIFLLDGDSLITSLIEDLLPGYYTLQASDDAGCAEQQNFSIEALGPISVNITGDTVLAENGIAQLYCSITPSDSLSTYLWEPADLLDDPTVRNPICTILDSTQFVVIVTSYAGCTAQDSVLVFPWTEVPTFVPDPCGEAFLPTIFSPNNDGLNDKLCLLGGCFESIAFNIYDRWGQRVYQSNKVEECWDGKHGGADLPAGAYTFTLTAIRTEGEVVERTGTLTLKR